MKNAIFMRRTFTFTFFELIQEQITSTYDCSWWLVVHLQWSNCFCKRITIPLGQDTNSPNLKFQSAELLPPSSTPLSPSSLTASSLSLHYPLISLSLFYPLKMFYSLLSVFAFLRHFILFSLLLFLTPSFSSAALPSCLLFSACPLLLSRICRSQLSSRDWGLRECHHWRHPTFHTFPRPALRNGRHPTHRHTLRHLHTHTHLNELSVYTNSEH